MLIIASPNTTATILLADLARCGRELAQIAAAPEDSGVPAFLPTLGWFDWQGERKLIQLELAALAAGPGERKEPL